MSQTDMGRLQLKCNRLRLTYFPPARLRLRSLAQGGGTTVPCPLSDPKNKKMHKQYAHF